MQSTIVSKISVDCSKIRDWNTFHDEFARIFGFPDFYGRNMDAWIDCMTSLDDPEDGLSQIHCARGSVLTLELDNVEKFKKKSPKQYAALIECSAFVNWRRIESGGSSVIAISFWSIG